MKRLSIIAIAALLFAVGCTSKVESYIHNEFPRVVRAEGLKKELSAEIKRMSTVLKEMATEADPNAKKGQALAAKANQMDKNISSRIDKFRRTGDYSYVSGIYNAVEAQEGVLSQSQSYKRKAQPYINHTNKQIKRLTTALNSIDALPLLSVENLAKVDSVGIEYVFTRLIGLPGDLANLEDAEVQTMAVAVLTNYLVDNPTPTIKSCEYREDMDNWDIVLSNDVHYTLNAIECSNGEYEYQYRLVADPFARK